MKNIEKHAVTGAFGYSGKYIAQRLLDKGHNVITLTNSLDRPSPFGDSVKAHPFNFDKPEELAASLEGVKVLYNTYWVRFNHKTFTHAEAVQNSFTLFAAAKKAGVERVVHISITNPSLDSGLEYFSGKAQIEENLKESGLSYAILRPTVLFGKEDILVNNIAWALRRLPCFGLFGRGDYKLQPIHVDDLAQLAVEQGESREDAIIDAIGPETFTYRELVESIAQGLGIKRLIFSVPPMLGYVLTCVLGLFHGDVIITREEIRGLMQGLLYVDSPPAGKTALSEWTRENADWLGKRYTSELARRIDRSKSYGDL